LPPNEYELLGVSTFEDDTGRIRIGYQRQLAKVRQHLEGGRRADAQRIVDELSRAYQRLSDTERKAEYDDELLGVNTSRQESADTAQSRRRSDTLGDTPSTWTQIPPLGSVESSQLVDDEEYTLKELPEEKQTVKKTPAGARPAPATPSGQSGRTTIVCSCGQKLAVPETLAGKKVRCCAAPSAAKRWRFRRRR
jgi:curved DNA-binding protein CbpA